MKKTRTPPLPFALPDIGEKEIAEVVHSMRSGWLTTGPKTVEFEKRFARFLGKGVETVAVNSGTAGLHLALEALGVGPGDEVITTTYTFTATAEVVRYLGADPVFVDVEADAFTMDPALVEAAVSEKTRAVIPVHFAGEARGMPEILRIARRHCLKVVEDAAHSLPSLCDGALIGALPSDAAVFSFYATKPLATGEGGMLATRDAELAGRCKVMRLHGIDRDAFDRYRSERPAWYYEVVAPGFKYNMPDLAAAIGLVQLAKTFDMHRGRMAIAQRYDEALADLPVLPPPRPENREDHAWHLYVLRLTDDAPVDRDRFIEEMSRRGIGTSVHFIPLHRHPYWRNRYELTDDMFPNASAAYQRVVSLPIYSKMTDNDVERVITATREILHGRT